MFDKILNWAKGLFVNPEGGINWRTLIIAGAGAAAGATGLMGLDLMTGLLVGGGAAALVQTLMPGKPENTELQVIDTAGKKEEKDKGKGEEQKVEMPGGIPAPKPQERTR